MARYPGAKGAAGVVQKIVSLMPEHMRYFELFLGTGVVLRAKAPALQSIVSDLDLDVIAWHRGRALPRVVYRHADYWEVLSRAGLGAGDLVYLDPPYHPDTRSKRRLYRFEMGLMDHERLLARVKTLPIGCAVMISGYRCEVYDEMLDGWHRTDFRAMTRGGVRTESVWTNFTPGVSFHDVKFAGADYRERWRIKKKVRRWVAKIGALPAIERTALLRALDGTTQEARS